jgi:hypothetical protein
VRSSIPSYSLPLSLLSLNPPHYFSSLIPLHPLPHYLSPSFLSVILSPSFLSILLLTTSLSPSPSFSLALSWMERNEGGEVVRRIERKEGERQ